MFGAAVVAFMRRRQRNIDEAAFLSPEKLEYTHILHWTPRRAHPVDGVARDPDHRGEGHEEADGVRPGGVLHRPVLDGLPSEAVEEEDDGHDEGGNDAPGESPVEVGLEAGHLLHAVRKLLHPKDPADGNCLKWKSGF